MLSQMLTTVQRQPCIFLTISYDFFLCVWLAGFFDDQTGDDRSWCLCQRCQVSIEECSSHSQDRKDRTNELTTGQCEQTTLPLVWVSGRLWNRDSTVNKRSGRSRD